MPAFEESPIISATELTKVIGRQNVKVFDVRGPWGGHPRDALLDYTQSHIPEAIFIDWAAHFLKPGVPVELAPVASEQDAKRSFEALGISEKDTVILYDDYHHMMAARMWWAMRYWGFSNIKVLNGGFRHWRDQGFETSSGAVEPSRGAFEPVKNDDLRVGLEELIETKNSLNLIDSRGPVNFKGDDQDERSGHIPGALNIPYGDVMDPETGLFKSASELQALFHERLPDFKDTPVVTSCGAGYAGTVTLLALASIGVNSSLFDDSFLVWKNNTDLPVEKGA